MTLLLVQIGPLGNIPSLQKHFFSWKYKRKSETYFQKT